MIAVANLDAIAAHLVGLIVEDVEVYARRYQNPVCARAREREGRGRVRVRERNRESPCARAR